MWRRMIHAAGDYFSHLTDAGTRGWNQFWFAPSSPLTVSVVRPLVGLVALYYLASFSFELDRWFGPQAWLTVDSVRQLTGGDPLSGQVEQASFRPSIYSVASLAGSGAVMAVHLVGLVLAASFTAGLLTRLTSIGTLLFVLSAIHRNPLVTGPFEPVLVVLLLGLTIANSGAFCSLDRLRSGLPCCQGNEADWTTTLGVRLMQIQIAALFFMMAISKLAVSLDDFHTWWTGEGVWLLIAKSESRLIDLTPLRDAVFLVNFWTHSIVAFELVFAFGIWNPLLRPILLAISVVMWGSLALVSGLVPFCLTMFLAGLIFIDPATLAHLLASDDVVEPIALKG